MVVDQSQALAFLEHCKQTVIPAYEFADGLVWIDVYERTLGAHEEVLTISLWRSEQLFMSTLHLGLGVRG